VRQYPILWLFRLTQLPGELCLIVRLRLDAALYQPAPARQPGTKGRPRKKGERLPTLEQVAAAPKTPWRRVTIPNWYGEGRRAIELVSQTAVWFHGGLPALPIRWVLIRDPKGKFKTQALLCTDMTADPVQIVKWFVLRWQTEVTYHEVREHLGVETQRQWSDLATLAPRAGRVRVLRTTPALLGLFSLVTLLAHQHTCRRKLPIRQTAWYHKMQPTFSDALALVRRQIWQELCFEMTAAHTNSPKLFVQLQNRLLSALCYTP
jgi:hypothetical protein